MDGKSWTHFMSQIRISAGHFDSQSPQNVKVNQAAHRRASDSAPPATIGPNPESIDSEKIGNGSGLGPENWSFRGPGMGRRYWSTNPAQTKSIYL